MNDLILEKISEAQRDVKVQVLIPELMIDCEEIKGIDVNPLFVLPQGQGVVAVDARIITEA